MIITEAFMNRIIAKDKELVGFFTHLGEYLNVSQTGLGFRTSYET